MNRRSIPIRNFNFIDSTLREGEQFRGTHFTIEDKREIASLLDRFGVEYMELSTPVASPQSAAAIRALADTPRRFKLLTHIRANMDDARLAVDCGVDGADVYIGTSRHMREYSHGKSLEQVIEIGAEVIRFLKEQGAETRFSTEDTFRSNFADVMTVYRAMDLAGVDRVGVADTVGIADPLRTYNLISNLRDVVDCDIEFHGHNDSSCAVANAFCALQAGATHIDTTVLGIGERNGITPMGALVGRLYTCDKTLVEKYDLRLLPEIERTVAEKLGIEIPYNTPITGEVAFHHKAGVHTNAVLKNPTTYEAIAPEDFGLSRIIDVAHRLVGRNAIRDHAVSRGLDLPEDALQLATAQVKLMADERPITVEDVDRILEKMMLPMDD
ncbi:MAG: homocitrate synthase [Chloroflexota bacterium]|nr:homocitrate synthase [Chloroflexota bacterium]MDE2948271.1 homocitrate synthase [Chloroflexota bacterium]